MIITEGIPEWLKISVGTCQGDREYQQDRMTYFTRKDHTGCMIAFLGIICDGMGGMKAGEQASACAVNTLQGCLNNRKWENMTGAELLYQCFLQMDLEVSGLKDQEGKLLYSGTTAVAVYIHMGELSVCSVGDSKVYLIRDGQMIPLTKEHNYQMLLDQGRKAGNTTEEEYQQGLSRKDALVSYIGMGHLPYVDLNQEPISLQPGDQLLLCSDGLYRAIPEEQLVILLERERNPEYGLTDAEVLIQAAVQAGNRPLDNITAMVIRCEIEGGKNI